MVKQITLVRALLKYKGKYLLLKKAKDVYYPENIGKYECPGGIIEGDESAEETALKETKQETGLKCNIIRELPTLQITDEKYISNCRVYLLEAESDKVILSDEHTEYVWVEPQNVKIMDLVLYASLLLEYFNNPDIYLN